MLNEATGDAEPDKGVILERSAANGMDARQLGVVSPAAESVVPCILPWHTDNQQRTVLVVEDEAAVRSLTRKVLEKHGYRVFTACDGMEALNLARQLAEPIDLLVTDVVMPNLNGRELVNRLLPERPGIKILYMSGYSEEAIRQHGVLHPGTAFLEKPFTPEVLARKVRAIFEACV